MHVYYVYIQQNVETRIHRRGWVHGFQYDDKSRMFSVNFSESSWSRRFTVKCYFIFKLTSVKNDRV